MVYCAITFAAVIVVLCVVICSVIAIYRRKKIRREERFPGSPHMHYMDSQCVMGKRVDSDISLWSEPGAPVAKNETDLWCVTGVGSQDFSSLDHVDLIINDDVNESEAINNDVNGSEASSAAYPDLEFEHEHTERGHATFMSRS